MKALGVILIFLFGSLCQAQLSNGLLLEYKCNGNADDSSGNNHNATVHGATLSPDRNGNPNSAYYFDGVDDYIEWPNLDVLKPQLPVSFSFWVRYDSTDWQDQTVFSTSEEDDRAAGVWFNSTAADAKFAVNYGDGSPSYTSATRRTFIADTVIDTNNWYHLVVVVKSATDMHIYVNCDEFEGAYSGSGGTLEYSTFPGVIGKHDRSLGGTPDFFKGYIDDFMYWNREVSPEEVFGLCQNEPPPVFAVDQGCNGADYQLTAVPDQPVPPETTYSWSGPGNFSASGNPVTVTNLATGTYTVTATLPGNVTVTQSVEVSGTMCLFPVFSIAHGCTDDDYVLTATADLPAPPQTVYAWSGPGNFSGSGDSVVITGLSSGTYSLNVTLPNGGGIISTSVEITNTICSAPAFAINQDCVDNAYLLTAVPNQPLTVEGNYTWSGPASFSATGNPVVITGQLAGTYSFIATFPNNVTATQSANVSVTACTIKIPKGVTPDDDINNTFDLTGFDVARVKIFNRYGMTVYEKSGYVNQWRGQDNSGNELPSATYYYLIELTSGQTQTGWVYLQRR